MPSPWNPKTSSSPHCSTFPAPILRAYTKETALSEKFEAMVTLGERNSRLKDYFDVWLLSQRFDFQGDRLAQAIAATFARRKTTIPRDIPVGLSSRFAEDPVKNTQWKAFWLKVVRTEPIPDFNKVVATAREFLIPAAMTANRQDPWSGQWSNGGPWRHG